ncbi:hypothetical protein ANRL3_00872 [Anaerolineae bacterium]|nr:hypothetical protein ANRL3_00872 [Anaerolineae bacterium]
MDTSQLRTTLEQLHTELERAQTVDDESRQLLQHLQSDIQAVLKESSDSARASLRTRLETALAHFEDSHSQLTLTIKNVLDHLAQV